MTNFNIHRSVLIIDFILLQICEFPHRIMYIMHMIYFLLTFKDCIRNWKPPYLKKTFKNTWTKNIIDYCYIWTQSVEFVEW